MDIEIKCDCGNPDCKAELVMHKGYVHIRRSDGSKEERWDYLHIDVYSRDEKREWIELMVPPEIAREIMWWFISFYMPGVHHMLSWLHRHVKGNIAVVRDMIDQLRGR